MTGPAPTTPAAPAPDRLFRAQPPPRPPLFDVHVNALPPGVADPAGDGPSGFYARITVNQIGSLGLAGGCVSPPALHDFKQANRAMADWSASPDGGAGRWLAYARLGGPGGPRPITGVWQLRAAARARLMREKREDDVDTLDGFAGVKLMPHVSGAPSPATLAAVAERRLPVLVHAGALCPPGWIADHLLPALPGTPVILAHLGSWPCAAELVEQAVELADRDERVYLGTSGASIGNFLAHAAGRVPNKLLFSSNTPMCPPSVQWGHLAAAVKDDAVLERIAWRNARAVFGDAVATVVASASTSTSTEEGEGPRE